MILPKLLLSVVVVFVVAVVGCSGGAGKQLGFAHGNANALTSVNQIPGAIGVMVSAPSLGPLAPARGAGPFSVQTSTRGIHGVVAAAKVKMRRTGWRGGGGVVLNRAKGVGTMWGTTNALPG